MIVVVVLTYHADAALFDRCLASVLASGDADRVIVVDNGQTLDRGRIDAISAAAGGNARAVDLLITEENLGYAGGMNAGISHGLALGATAIALLNDDTVVEPGWLEALEVHLGGDRIGAVQPKLLLDRPAADTGPVLINSVGLRVRSDGAGIDVGYGEVDAGQYPDAGPIDLFTGGAVLLDARLIRDVGGFDERYFLYFEDIDLGRRGRAAGWTYLVEPASVVHHAMSSTTKTMPGMHRYWQERNRLWCLFRHGTAVEVLLGLLRSLARLAKHPTRPQATAIVDGLRGAPRCWSERRRHVVLLPYPAARRWTVV